MIFGSKIQQICFSSRNPLCKFLKVKLITARRKGLRYLKKVTAFYGLIVRINDQKLMELLEPDSDPYFSEH